MGRAAPGTAARPRQYKPYCWPDAPDSVEAFLGYLQKIGAGMSAYELSAGYLLKANKQWTDTTNYTDSPWNDSYCVYNRGQKSQPPPPPPLLGAGADILAWFQQQN